MLKAFRWFPFALSFLAVDWWKPAGSAVLTVTVLGVIFTRSISLGGLLGLCFSCVLVVIWLLVALWQAWRDRDQTMRPF
ncbi:MAG: hypothetical protein K2W95_24855 [Candidatus Obscuribacterales bacterium]|nr:hypothetical protein [Candidatus Obscuribacterales bacterium]